MVRKLIRFVYKDIEGLHEAAYILGFFAFLSQVLGLIRDRLLAHIFGASSSLDVYYAAFRIPDFLFATVASLVSLSVLIPFLSKRIEEGFEQGREFISHVFTFFLATITIVGLGLFVAMPYIAPFIYGGFSESELTEVINLSRLLLLSPLLLGISNLLGSITQVFRRFFLFALSPLLYNIGIIAGILFLKPSMGIMGVGFGVVIGALLHALIQFPYVLSISYVPKISIAGALTDMLRVIKLSIPRTITLSMHQIVLLVFIGYASLLREGSISIFTFSFNLQSVPLAIIGVSYSVAAFPTLARLYAQKKFTEYAHQIVTATRHIIFLSIPAIILFVVLRAQIVRTLLGSGEFGWTATRLTAATLALLVASLVFQALTLLFVRGEYASGRTWRPLVINGIGSFVMIVSAFSFHWLFTHYEYVRFFFESILKVSDLPGTSILMLALGYTFGFMVNGMLFYGFMRKEIEHFETVVLRVLFQTLSASVIMGFVSYHLLIVFADVFNIATLLGIFLQGLSAGIGGIIAGITMLYVLGSRELSEVLRTLHSRFLTRGAISPDREEL